MVREFSVRLKRGIVRRAKGALGRLGLSPEPHPAWNTSEPVHHKHNEPFRVPTKPFEEVVVEPEDLGPTLEQVEELLEDLVRPALQADGGDISLIKVEDGDIYVELLGACSHCPSSTITMRDGIERLMVEELPGFQRLIQVQS